MCNICIFYMYNAQDKKKTPEGIILEGLGTGRKLELFSPMPTLNVLIKVSQMLYYVLVIVLVEVLVY